MTAYTIPLFAGDLVEIDGTFVHVWGHYKDTGKIVTRIEERGGTDRDLVKFVSRDVAITLEDIENLRSDGNLLYTPYTASGGEINQLIIGRFERTSPLPYEVKK